MALIYATTIMPFVIAWRLIRFAYLVNVSLYRIGAWVVGAVMATRGPLAAFRKWRDKDKPTHGDAAFATDKELKTKGHFENKGFLACVTESGKKVFTHFERTALILAPPGSGKSQHLISHIHTLMERPDADLPFLFVGDAADECYLATEAILRARGYGIIKIDCVEPDKWARSDVLSDLDPSPLKRFVFARQLNAICELMVPDDVGSKQPHFVRFARLLLKCAIRMNVLYEGNNKPICDIIDELVDDDDRDALLKRAAKYNDRFLTSTLKTMKKMQDKPEGVSMISTALQKLESWSDDAIREVSRNGWQQGAYVRGWKMEDMFRSNQPVALFLRTGTQRMGGDFARIIYGNAINTVSKMLDTDKKALSRDLEVIVDEAGLTGYCNAISHAYARLRKARVRVRMCFVGLKEFEDTYPDAETIWAGSDIIMMGSSNEDKLNQRISVAAGEYTVQSRSQSESEHGESKGKSEQARRLVKADEVRRNKYGPIIVLLQGMTVRGLPIWRISKKTGRPEYL